MDSEVYRRMHSIIDGHTQSTGCRSVVCGHAPRHAQQRDGAAGMPPRRASHVATASPLPPHTPWACSIPVTWFVLKQDSDCDVLNKLLDQNHGACVRGPAR